MSARYVIRGCSGLRIDPTCGALECPRGYWLDEDAGETWDEACGRCRAEDAYWEELTADRERDETWDACE